VARRKDQAARRRQLKQAARRAIASRGVEGVRVKDIAAEAGLSSQAVLYYYPDLDDLIEEAIQHTLERFAERRFEAAERSDDPRRALVEAIAAGLPAGADDEDLRVLYGAAAYFRDKPALGDSSEAIARNIVALEDAYGLYIIGGAPIATEAPHLIRSFASMAVGSTLDPPPT
jgi:AcrR family transcriptional regulator